jgi:hypothetical protein
MTGCPNVIRACPQIRQTAFEFRKLFAQLVSGKSFEPVHNLVRGYRGRKTTKQVNVVGLNGKIENFAAKFCCLLVEQFYQSFGNLANQNGTAILGYPDKVPVDVIRCVSSSFAFHKLRITQKGGMRQFPFPPEGGSTLGALLWYDSI